MAKKVLVKDGKVLATGNKVLAAEETVAGYSVTVTTFDDRGPGSGGVLSYGAFYSTDNGTTWTRITGTGLLGNFTQIKFYMDIDYDPVDNCRLWNGDNIIINCPGHSTVESSNYILTEDMSNIMIYFMPED